MLRSYNECIEKYNNDYGIKKAISDGKLFKIEKGIYSEDKFVPELQIIKHKYRNAIITLNSAFYYHSLTDAIPEFYYLATDRAGSKIRDKRVKQIFEMKKLLKIGMVEIERQGILINIYDKERMLIELIRNKHKLPYDYYKEIIGNYRNIVFELDIERIQEYAMMFPKSGLITETLFMEVF
ncbi:MAG: hypothetical protein JW702_09480 [Clostridiales bacterium]|nr:hypothetical protein [Clostridiales bacterium]